MCRFGPPPLLRVPTLPVFVYMNVTLTGCANPSCVFVCLCVCVCVCVGFRVQGSRFRV
jgi:hypothetical protein